MNKYRWMISALLMLVANLLFAGNRDKVLVVSQSGDAAFKTIQQAFDAVPESSSGFTRIVVKPGIYKEKVVLPVGKNRVIVEGEQAANTVIDWNDHTGKVVNGDTINTFTSSTLSIRSDEVIFRNLTVSNSAGRVGQAVACEILGDRVVFKDCRFVGDQDTFFTRGVGRVYCLDCHIEGTTDFIFGSSVAVFERCSILSKKNSYVTAASTLEGNKYGYVFLDCTLSADSVTTKVYLGRPWRPFAKTVFIGCVLGNHILPEGWHNWNKPHAEKSVLYAEYRSKGPGANPASRPAWTRQLTDKEAKVYTIENIFAKDAYRAGFEQDWNPVSMLKRMGVKLRCSSAA